MVAGISLANKSQLLFGFAVVVILAAALSVPWVRTRLIIEDYQIELARQIADALLTDRIKLGSLEAMSGTLEVMDEVEDEDQRADPAPLRLAFVHVRDLPATDDESGFIDAAAKRFLEDPDANEHTLKAEIDDHPVYRYARAVRESQMRAIRDPSVTEFGAPPFEPGLADPLRGVLIVDRTTRFAEGQLLRSQIFILAAGVVGTLLAILVFYFILTKLILFPVRLLRETTEKVKGGDLSIRSTIQTGDEFEQLAEAFNSMLDRVGQGQEQLRAINQSLDLKVGELAEANVGLYESNRLKSEFLASVSHELRTPLNSIIGFAELLREMAGGDEHVNPKRVRYLDNILGSGRALLDMINELLDMAKIEAGRMELNLEQTSVVDVVEGLTRIMRPQAEAKGLELRTELGDRVPTVETDPGKLQQILYNFLSNAIKFTPPGGSVTLSADRVTRLDNSLGVRIAVADTGPGIPEDLRDMIFDKFRQLDASHTRAHQGTGLGLAICRELAQMLGANVSVVSEANRGATFYVDIPLAYRVQQAQPLMGDG